MSWSDSTIPGVRIAEASAAVDERGFFAKPWTAASSAINLRPDEVFFSVSRQGTVRGMHAQKGHAAGHRLVFVTRGCARDFVIDLRVGSPTFGEVIENTLRPGGLSVLVAPGCAHGFEALQDDTTMVYVQEGAHQPELDIGVHWSACGFTPSAKELVVSERDEALPRLNDFVSPFRWQST